MALPFLFAAGAAIGIFGTTGFVSKPKTEHKTVEELPVRPDGKVICNWLKQKRNELARLNNISYASEPCSSQGPCAGTCPKCDAEAAYLDRELSKIPKDKIKYPDMKID